ncbi:dihydroxy-acid dehydratase [Gallibacterium salpingitidis]|uniref:Dihydroxy-acid dehydratase n=1 Tax=Gallibacterium salpingitidis TaxID=505341 RepID=A0AB36E259_9PAST|nr:IlvD/Edd family dehydratase [Gallibacterium salpingitidis]OBX09037.1 dihydroxy-acid dehydratase [Gallibacterium salpingitidis]OBX10157.1 dihydroxy-acid dehydratase [Gallibacterium salpingitidis]
MKKNKRLRSQDWFDNKDHIDMAALYLERFMNFGITPEELRSGKPIIGIAQSGSDLVPCNRIHLELSRRIKDGIRDAGGIPLEFPTHPLFENCKRPTAALDRNLAYLSLVEVLYGYPIDGVVLTTGCDKSTPSAIMAALTLDIPAIVLNGGPMLNGYHNNQLVGSGTVIWQSRRRLAAGEIDEEEFFRLATSSAPSAGHCNTMGTASTMNCMAEVMGLTLPGSAIIPAPYKERPQMAYYTGKEIVKMVKNDLTISKILTKNSILNAIRVNSALGGSTNVQPHLSAIAKHAGIALTAQDWKENSHHIPLLTNVQPSGKFLCEEFYRAGGVPAVMWELLQKNMLFADELTVNGKTIRENISQCETNNRDVIYPYDNPLQHDAGFIVLSGNIFDFAIMKTSVITEEFRKRYLEQKDHKGVFKVRAIVFDGSEDYHDRIDDPSLNIDENCILIMRGAGPIGWPGAAEVVNMRPPSYLLKKGINSLPTLGDGRQSGTSDSPSILHVSPESAVGGGIAYLKTGDMIEVDINNCICNVLLSEEEWNERKKQPIPEIKKSQTPWQEIYRSTVTQLNDGAIIDLATKYRQIAKVNPRHNH